MFHLHELRSRVLWYFFALLLPFHGDAQIILGKYSFGTPQAEPLDVKVKMKDAEFTPSFPAGVGGISFDRVAEPVPELVVERVKLLYEAGAPDGQRLHVLINGQDAVADLPDWMLLPIARYADSDAYSCFTLFGDLKDAKLQKLVLDADGRVLNYHTSFFNTLLGLRLAYMDMLLLYPDFTSDLPMKGGDYLLGSGESPPDKAANKHALALLGNGVNRIMLELQQQFRSYIISDHERPVTFSVTEGHLRLSGDPYFYCWRSMYMRPDYDQKAVGDSIEKAMKTEMDAALAAKRYSSGQAWVVEKTIAVMHDYDGRYAFHEPGSDFTRILAMPTDEERRAALMRYDPSSLFNLAINTVFQMDQRRIDHMTDFSERLSALAPQFARANPAVWNATVQTMRYAAFFRYVRQQYPSAWLAFLAQIEGVAPMPAAVTPTVLYPSDNAALKARMKP